MPPAKPNTQKIEAVKRVVEALNNITDETALKVRINEIVDSYPDDPEFIQFALSLVNQ